MSISGALNRHHHSSAQSKRLRVDATSRTGFAPSRTRFVMFPTHDRIAVSDREDVWPSPSESRALIAEFVGSTSAVGLVSGLVDVPAFRGVLYASAAVSLAIIASFALSPRA
jgi:hypothetical protein